MKIFFRLKANSSLVASAALTSSMLVVFMFSPPATYGSSQAGIVSTKHNLSKTGPGITSNEDRICIFCHTPHNAFPQTPLWNKKIEANTYFPYSSSTMVARPSQPTGPTRLCLTCHDGTIALGAVIRPLDAMTGMSVVIQTSVEKLTGRPSYLGVSLSDDHPVSFSYYDSLPNSELAPGPPSGLLFYNNGTIHCSTCHDPHTNANKKFLTVNNEQSGLCLKCHNKPGWMTSSHSLSPSTWNGSLPNPWPRTGAGTDFNWSTVKQNGCENCHAPHSAPEPRRLLNSALEENNCFPCHNGNVSQKSINIQAQFENPLKTSRHGSMSMYSGRHDPRESPKLIQGHVECVDCHNPHRANERTASAPYVSGKTEGVSGVTIQNFEIKSAENEYEICFKCHASTTAQSQYSPIPRVVNVQNTREEFQSGNPSYHPVTGTGKNFSVPSLSPPSFETPDLSPSSRIYCTDCHSDEDVSDGGSGSRGPHASKYAPLLRRRYDTTIGSIENTITYALCYRCHNRDSILTPVVNDQSFKQVMVDGQWKGGHPGHLSPTGIYAGKNIPCAVCHDPHGVIADGNGSHAHLINFTFTGAATDVVKALSPNTVPIFKDNGTHMGSCTLVCHFDGGLLVKEHSDASYGP